MVNPTPTKRSQSSSQEASHLELSREEWISNLLLKATLRPRLRSLPFVWMIVVSAVVFPIGVWSHIDSIGAADETHTAAPAALQQEVVQEEVAATTVEAPEAVASDESAAVEFPTSTTSTPVLPVLPDPTIASQPAVRKMSITVLVSGKTFDRDIEATDDTTIRDAIQACGLKLYELDRVFPAPDEKPYHGLSIRITRVRNEIKKRTRTIEPVLRYRPSAALKPGQQKVEQSGKPGLIEVSERIWFKDGEVTMRQALDQTTVRQPEDKIIAIGARPFYLPGKIPYHNRYASAYSLAARAGSPRDRVASHETKSLRPIKSMILTATGYSPDPRENGGYTVTATGLPISYGAAAVDPRVIPLGTKLYVEGYGYAFACDVGGAIKGNKIDLAYDSYRLANTKGRKKVKVWILAP